MINNLLKFGLPAWILLMGGSCLMTGCKSGNADWNADQVNMSTQFEVAWGTSVKIGFPGTVHGDAKGGGQLKEHPAAGASTAIDSAHSVMSDATGNP